jgi:hypothetical protein
MEENGKSAIFSFSRTKPDIKAQTHFSLQYTYNNYIQLQNFGMKVMSLCYDLNQNPF